MFRDQTAVTSERDTETDVDDTHSRRQYLAGAAVAVTVGTAGCISTGLRVEANVDESSVFDAVSLAESWATGNATATVTLTESATKEKNVRAVAVIDATGTSVWSSTLDPGQRSVSNVRIPVGNPSTLVAADESGKFVDEIAVRVSGSPIP